MAAIPTKDFEIGAGDSLAVEARYRVNGVPVDLTQFRVDFMLSWSDTSRQMGAWRASSTDGRLMRDASGRIQTMVPMTVMRDVVPRSIVRYRIVVTSPSGVQTTILRGMVRIRQ